MRVSLLSILTLGLIAVWSTSGVTSQETPKPVLCYFGAWSVYRWSYGKFDVEDIDPFMCTHVVFGFAGLHPSEYTIMSLDPYNDFYDNWGKGAYDRFTNLKLINPNLKTLLAIGGWNEGASKYSEMAKTPERRQAFIQSCVQMLLDHNFDGLDMDWEYPGGREDSPGDPVVDKDNFSALIREMRAAFDEHNLMITAAVSAGKNTIDLAYDVPVMAETLDFFNVMTYDYHGWFKNHTYTAHNCPLHQMPEESEEGHPGYHLNQEFSMDYYVQLGARKEQLLMGLAAYGRGFTLQNPAENGFYAPAVAGCDPGYYTGTSGFWGFNEYCERMYVKGELDQWTEVRDENVVSPYIVRDSQWFSFEDIQSIEVKAQFIKDNGYGGAMVWSIDTDDFQGFCSEKRFGLIQKVQDVLNGGPQTPPPGYTTPLPVDPTTRPPSGSTPPPNEICDGTPGLKPDPENCHHYYSCVPQNGEWGLIPGDCGENLAFDPISQACAWPDQVPGCSEGTAPTSPPGGDTTPGNPDETTLGPNPDESLCEGSEGFHRDPKDCSIYYQCVLNEAGHFQVIPGHCADGLFFDMESFTCNWANNVDCPVKV
uniref:Chitinase 3 n=1 Tax=Tigriopus japonicus TaxID=158387 RepID=A0A1U9XQU1_TIGJA|nr:chitinase 3 [Tigriopus japonicus]